MDLLPGAAGVLGILNDFEKKKALSTFETIRAHVNWERQGKDDQALTGVLDQLVGYELATHSETVYSLTKKGSVQLKQSMSQGFSAMMLAAEQSAVSKKFCQQVYGIDLCQFNMMSRAQLDKLLEEMNLGKDDHILDLDCGVGLISEYVSDVTGAAVFGIDFASGVIERARERTVKKRGRLSYQVMDMDALSLPSQSFSGVISIDTLYFVNDLEGTIRSVRECLRMNGRMGILYSTRLSPEEAVEVLEPRHTPLAKVLQQ